MRCLLVRVSAAFRRRVATALACAVVVAGCDGAQSSSPPPTPVRVRIDTMIVHGVAPHELGIFVYADGAASVEFGARPPHVLVDTLRLRSTPSFTLDVSEGAVHVDFVHGQLGGGGGVIYMSGYIIGADSIRFRGVGRHLLVEQGGTGIRVIDRGNPQLMLDMPNQLR